MLRRFLYQRIVQQYAHFTQAAPHFRKLHAPCRFQFRIIEDRADYDGTVIGFAAMMEGKDTSTMAHLFRVRDYCTLLAREMGVPEESMRDIQLGAMLHDIGKYRVPDAILTKPGPLDDDGRMGGHADL